MPGPPTTNNAKSAKLVKQGHTKTGKFGDDPNKKKNFPNPTDISPKG